MEEAKKNLTANGFAYSNPNKKSSGLGGYWGCIGKKFEHMQDYEVLTKEQKPVEVVHELRQVVTNPSKLGYGYSVPGIGMGAPAKMGEEVKTSKWGFAEIEHSVDPYDMARQYENAERKFNQEALLGRPPFKTVSHALDFFDHKKGAPPHSPRARARPHGRDSSCAARADPRPRRAPRRCTPSRSAPCARQSRCSPPPPPPRLPLRLHLLPRGVIRPSCFARATAHRQSRPWCHSHRRLLSASRRLCLFPDLHRGAACAGAAAESRRGQACLWRALLPRPRASLRPCGRVQQVPPLH